MKDFCIYDINIVMSVHSNCIDSIYADLGGLVVWYLKWWPELDFQPDSAYSKLSITNNLTYLHTWLYNFSYIIWDQEIFVLCWFGHSKKNLILRYIWKGVLLNCAPTSTQFHPPPSISIKLHPPPPSLIHLHQAYCSLHPALCNTLNV